VPAGPAAEPVVLRQATSTAPPPSARTAAGSPPAPLGESRVGAATPANAQVIAQRIMAVARTTGIGTDDGRGGIVFAPPAGETQPSLPELGVARPPVQRTVVWDPPPAQARPDPVPPPPPVTVSRQAEEPTAASSPSSAGAPPGDTGIAAPSAGSAPVAPAVPAAAPHAGPAAGGAPGLDLDLLARQVYERIVPKLITDHRLGRERAGRLIDAPRW
jgi:hypothetical protein